MRRPSLRVAFEEQFWDPQEGTFVWRSTGDKRRVSSVTSNPAHCLYCDMLDPPEAASVARAADGAGHVLRLGHPHPLQPSPAYNPMSYHNGSVWPHDNAIDRRGPQALRLR